MKRILTSALAIVLFVGAAQAQDKGRGHHNGHRYAKELNLTTDQKAKLKSLRDAQRKEMETLRQGGNTTPEQRKALHEKYKAQYEAILTPEQRQQVQERKTDWKQKHKAGHHGAGRGDERFGQMAGFFKRELDLTAAQESSLRGLYAEYQSKAKDIRTNNNLAADAKRTQLRNLGQQYMQQGKAVLTPAQVQKLESMRKNRKARG